MAGVGNQAALLKQRRLQSISSLLNVRAKAANSSRGPRLGYPAGRIPGADLGYRAPHPFHRPQRGTGQQPGAGRTEYDDRGRGNQDAGTDPRQRLIARRQ